MNKLEQTMTLIHPLLLAFTLVLSTSGFQTPFNAIRTSNGTPSSHLLAQTSPNDEQSLPHPHPTRRQFHQSLSSILASTTLLTSTAASATSLKLETYTDPNYGFRISTPVDWKTSTQTLSGRRKAVFFTPNDASGTIDTLMYIAYTPIRDDFTSLASFGSVDAVAQATILPKGELGGNSDGSKMLSAISKKNAYYFDYVSTPVVEVEAGSGSGTLTKQLKEVHFRTIFTLVPLKEGAGSTLVTVTLQTGEEGYGGYKGVFDEIIDSFERA